MLKSTPNLHDVEPRDVVTDRWTLSRRELIVWIVLVLGFPALMLASRMFHQTSNKTVALKIEEQPGKTRVVPAAEHTGARLDLNTATIPELKLLTGIGVRRAEKIVQHRTQNGPYQSIWELAEIKGISKRMIERLEPLIEVKATP